jgi:hypothetical protein
MATFGNGRNVDQRWFQQSDVLSARHRRVERRYGHHRTAIPMPHGDTCFLPSAIDDWKLRPWR